MTTPVLPVYAIARHRIAQDGDGVVTLVAVSGCPLHCKYCINPEGRDASAPTTQFTPQQLYDQVKIDDLYFQATDGGVTFGGGEPLMHPEFLREFARIAKSQWKLRVETSLNVPENNIFLPFDEYIVDVKDFHEKTYQNYTGKSGKQARDNLKKLLDFIGPEHIFTRVPSIPAYNTPDDVNETVETLKHMGITRIQTFPYRLPINPE